MATDVTDLTIYEGEDKTFTVNLKNKETGTAQSGASTSITLSASANANDDFYNNLVITLTGGTGSDQVKTITDYNGTTKVATVTTWDTNPDSTTTYSIASVPIDITGYTFLFTVKSKISDTDASAIIKKTITSHSDPTNGVTQIALVESDTEDQSGSYLYDFQRLDTSTDRAVILKRAKFTIEQRVGDSFSWGDFW